MINGATRNIAIAATNPNGKGSKSCNPIEVIKVPPKVAS
jgi:hypothetical protein